MKILPVTCSDELRLAEVQEDDRLSDVADGQWLVVMVENQNLPAQPAICTYYGFNGTEDLNASFQTFWSGRLRGCLKDSSNTVENIAFSRARVKMTGAAPEGIQ
jgi:hypothetical protein